MKPTLIVIAGPTAVGKTDIGIQLAKHFGCEIISADSRQIYKEPAIGTAVPEPEQLNQVLHYFIQTRSVKEYYNASMFEEEVLKTLELLFERNRFALMVGGSGLYINAVCDGIDELPVVDRELRNLLNKRLQSDGLESLTEELRELDPVSYNSIDLQNPMRVLRALEISIQTGSPYSGFLSPGAKSRPFRIIRLALDMEREKLYRRIDDRVEKMIEKGLVDEAKKLEPLKNYNAMKTVGYRELFSYLEGNVSLSEAIEAIKRNTHRFARKQITWFRKHDRYQWFHPDHPEKMIRWIENQLDCENG